MNKNLSIELLNKIGKYKKDNDPEDELSILECITELADKEGIELDYYTDVLADNPSFKIILKDDLTKRGLLYIDNKRVKKQKDITDWN